MRESIVVAFLFAVLHYSATDSVATVSDVINQDSNSVNGEKVNVRDKRDFYPSWAPFGKNIEELGEFVRSKPKPKKRLALPVNFVLKDVDANQNANVGNAVPVSLDKTVIKHETDTENNKSEEAKNSDETMSRPVRQYPMNSQEKEVEAATKKLKSSKAITEQAKQEYDEFKKKKEKDEKSSEEIREAEAKKQRVLGEVDKLKQVHAAEQLRISQLEIENGRLMEQEIPLKFKNKYASHEKYDDYDNMSESNEMKLNKPSNQKNVNSGENSEESIFTTAAQTEPPKTTTLSDNDITNHITDVTDHSDVTTEGNVRISLVPTVARENISGKRRKIKRRRKNKKKIATQDSTVAESTSGNATLIEITSPSSKMTLTDTIPASTEQKQEENITADTVPASTEHKKKAPENFEHEQGGDKEHHSEAAAEHAEQGKKAYKGYHKDTKTAKGHHDKEKHSGEYHDKGGHDKAHHKEHEHYGEHHHEEEGKKHAKYEESGKHSKGHSTKGSHDVHKKEEYEKKVEFFEEDGDSGDEETHGGYGSEKGHASGGHFKKANLNAGHYTKGTGESGEFAKGGHSHVHKGHKSAAGHDGFGERGHMHQASEGKESGKKWIYHHGHPAKTANLVPIDRLDKFYWPRLYG